MSCGSCREFGGWVWGWRERWELMGHVFIFSSHSISQLTSIVAGRSCQTGAWLLWLCVERQAMNFIYLRHTQEWRGQGSSGFFSAVLFQELNSLVLCVENLWKSWKGWNEYPHSYNMPKPVYHAWTKVPAEHSSTENSTLKKGKMRKLFFEGEKIENFPLAYFTKIHRSFFAACIEYEIESLSTVARTNSTSQGEMAEKIRHAKHTNDWAVHDSTQSAICYIFSHCCGCCDIRQLGEEDGKLRLTVDCSKSS